MTRFVAVRNFLRSPAVDVAKGDVLELNDAEAAVLVALSCVKPANAMDRNRMKATRRIVWEAVKDAAPFTQSCVR